MFENKFIFSGPIFFESAKILSIEMDFRFKSFKYGVFMSLIKKLKNLFAKTDIATEATETSNPDKSKKVDYSNGQKNSVIAKKATPLSASQALNDANDIEERIFEILPEYRNVSLSNPPGLAGAICKDLDNWEHRPIRELRPMVALNILSLLCGSRLNGDGKQMSLFLIGIASSSAGKGDQIDYTKLLLSKLGLGEFIYSAPRSDKSIYLDLFESGKVLYMVDEVQSLFSGMLSKKSSEFTQSMLTLLMELNTTSSATLPGNLKRELGAENSTMLKPFLGFSGYSTPSELAFILNERNIHSGLLGRFTFFPPGEVERHTKNHSISKKIGEDVITRCQKMLSETNQVVMSEAASNALRLLDDLFDENEYLNHPRLGAIYARGGEHIKRTSFVLGAETGIVEVHDILFSLRLFLNSINACKVPKNKMHRSENITDEALSVASKECADDWIMKSVLANKMTKNRAIFRKMHQEEPGSHYKVIQSLIERNLLLQDGKKVKLAD